MATMQTIWIYGIIFASLSIFPSFLHYIRCLYYSRKHILSEKSDFTPDITILLPVKDEEIVIKDKLQEILSMNYPLEKISLIIIDSKSKDKTIEEAEDFLKNQDIINYDICIVDRPGKSVAVNHALDLIKTDFFVMMDAEAILQSSSVKKLVRWFSDDDIGAVCGQLMPEKDDLDSDYRKHYNILRIGESAINSTPIFEGSICAFRLSALNGKINDNINSDDTQMSLLSIRNGFRSIMDRNITFIEPPTEGKNRRTRQLRRSQGLIRTLMMNWDMSLKSNIKLIYLHTFFFHIVMPWLFSLSIICLFISTYSSISDYGFMVVDKFKLSFVFFIVLCTLNFFRNFIFGITVLIQAQLLLLFGIKLHVWETNRDLRKKSKVLRKK